jgi:hypothetical protein
MAAHRLALIVAALVAASVAAGCDPCSGLATCTTGPRLLLEGSLIRHLTGAPQGGVRVDVIRTGGVGLAADSVSTTTNAQGHWSVAIPASAAGDVSVDIEVRSPDWGQYRVRAQQFSTTDRAGDGHVLGPWVVDPYFPYAAELYYRGPGDARVQNARITFIRRDGISFYDLTGTTNPPYYSATDDAGRVVLFDVNAHGVSVGTMIGDLVIQLPEPFVPDTIHDIHLETTQRLGEPPHILRYGIGPSLFYTGEFHNRSSDTPIGGVGVTFRRTGGVATDPETFTTVSRADGRFTFPLRPLGEGSVTGDLDVVPTLGSPFTKKGVVLRPHYDDGARFYGVWAVGPALPWVVLVQIGGRGVAGVEAEFHRTGGIPVHPADFVARSNSDGYIHLNPRPDAVGTVEADIIVHSPPPYAEIRTHLVLPTVENDTTGGVFAAFDLDRRSVSAPAAVRRP